MNLRWACGEPRCEGVESARRNKKMMVVYGMMDVRGEMQGQRTSNDGYETTFATTELDHETRRRRKVWTYKEQWDKTNRNCHRRRRSQYTRVFERILQYRLLGGSE